MNDPVKNPKHYEFENACLEVRDVIRDRISILAKEYSESLDFVGNVSYDYSNAIKYLLRAFFKGKPIEDLNKAKYCIDTLLDLLTSSEATTNQPVECESNISPALQQTIEEAKVPYKYNPNSLNAVKEVHDKLPQAKFKGQGW